MTSYEKIYEACLKKFKNFDIPLMEEDEVKSFLYDFLVPAIAKFHVCRTDLADRDDEQECFNQDLTDEEIEILSNYMVIGYTDSEYIQTPTLLKLHLTSTDFHALRAETMLNRLLEMHDYYIKENETWLSRYAWKNAYERGVRLGTNRYSKPN